MIITASASASALEPSIHLLTLILCVSLFISQTSSPYVTGSIRIITQHLIRINFFFRFGKSISNLNEIELEFVSNSKW